MASNMKSQITILKKQLSNAVEATNDAEIKSVLIQLKDEIVVSEDLIRETKIGLAVNKVRQSSTNKDIVDLAKEIIKKWKGDVKKNPKVETKKSMDVLSPSTSVLPSPSPTPGSPAVALKPIATSSKASTSTVPVATERRASLNGAPRTHKTDGIIFNERGSTGDKTREKCVEMLYDALSWDSDAPSDLILERARALESHVDSELNGTPAYRTKIRSLYLNLKDKNNPGLRADLVSGEIAIQRLYGMTPAEMASEEQQAANRKLIELNLFNAQGAAPQQAETDAFQCGKCKQRRTMYYQMQTRSADEPMTTFVTCLNCNNRWKFS